jgi:DNA-binding Lrp family transcriptional regulator
MVTFIILINTERTKVNSVAEAMVNLEQVSEVFSVSGNYDLVAIVRAKNNEDLADLVTEQLLGIEGIEETETMLALRSFSRHDLESMFAM